MPTSPLPRTHIHARRNVTQVGPATLAARGTQRYCDTQGLCGEPQAAVSLYTPGAGRHPFPFHHATVCADVAVRELYTQ